MKLFFSNARISWELNNILLIALKPTLRRRIAYNLVTNILLGYFFSITDTYFSIFGVV